HVALAAGPYRDRRPAVAGRRDHHLVVADRRRIDEPVGALVPGQPLARPSLRTLLGVVRLHDAGPAHDQLLVVADPDDDWRAPRAEPGVALLQAGVAALLLGLPDVLAGLLVEGVQGR